MKRCAILFLATALSTFAAGPPLEISLLENDILCVRASRVQENFAEQFRQLQPTNKIAGMILDLRFAGGDDSAADAAAENFPAKKTPLVILVNGQTGGAAAELALRLRAAGAGIVIGSTNSPGKISPDIAVAASADDEVKFLKNPYALPTTNSTVLLSSTNDPLPFVDHVSEAQLVRERSKDGDADDDSALTLRAAPPRPVIRDPALARAVDLIKGLAVVRESHL